MRTGTRSTLSNAPLAPCSSKARGQPRRGSSLWVNACASGGSRPRALHTPANSASNRWQPSSPACTKIACDLRPDTSRARQHTALRAASIDEEQYTEAEAREEFESSTRRPSAQPDARSGGSSTSSNGSSNGSGWVSGSGHKDPSGPFRLDTGQLAKLNGLAPQEVFTSGIISSAQARCVRSPETTIAGSRPAFAGCHPLSQ